jgi:hypothetical protein
MHQGCVAGANDGEEGSGGVVADIAKLSVGREEYYTRELAETCISDAPCKVRTAAISRYLRGHQRLLATSLEDRSVLGSVETLENKSAAKTRRTTVFVAAACRIRRVPDSASGEPLSGHRRPRQVPLAGRPSRSSDDDAQPPPGGAERLLDLLVGGGFGEQEAQVAVTVG